MIAVIVNAVLVIVGGGIGCLCKKAIPKRITDAIMMGVGLCILAIGITGIFDGKNTLIAIISIVLGAVVGSLIDIDKRLNSFGDWMQNRIKKDENSNSTFSEGMVTASLLFCVGSMTVTGSIQAGLTGDNSVLITKAMLDLVSSMMLASSLGIGVLLSAVAVFVIQGGLVLLAGMLAPVMSVGAINEMTCAGSILIIMIGTNLMGITKIKVADFLPAILFAPVLYNLVLWVSGWF